MKSAASTPQRLHKFLVPQLPKMVQVLREFTLAESPSTEKAAADRCAELIAAEWSKRPVEVSLIPRGSRGNHIRIVWQGENTTPKRQLLVLGHYDTVYSTGTLKKMPFHESG